MKIIQNDLRGGKQTKNEITDIFNVINLMKILQNVTPSLPHRNNFRIFVIFTFFNIVMKIKTLMRKNSLNIFKL